MEGLAQLTAPHSLEFLWPAPIQKTPGDCFVEKQKRKRPRKKKKKRMLKYLFFFSRCASIKQPDAHNFSCQAQFSSSSSLFSRCFFTQK
jgi:hypothetical protein